MPSEDSTPISTPLGTPEGSMYAPTDMSSDLSFSQSSFIEHPPVTPFHDSALSSVSGDNASLAPSSISADDEAEAEWQESLQQLELLVSLVVIPFFGKWVGRRCAYWAWTKFMIWKYPVDVIITNRKAFNIAGVVGVFSSPP